MYSIVNQCHISNLLPCFLVIKLQTDLQYDYKFMWIWIWMDMKNGGMRGATIRFPYSFRKCFKPFCFTRFVFLPNFRRAFTLNFSLPVFLCRLLSQRVSTVYHCNVRSLPFSRLFGLRHPKLCSDLFVCVFFFVFLLEYRVDTWRTWRMNCMDVWRHDAAIKSLRYAIPPRQAKKSKTAVSRAHIKRYELPLCVPVYSYTCMHV